MRVKDSCVQDLIPRGMLLGVLWAFRKILKGFVRPIHLLPGLAPWFAPSGCTAVAGVANSEPLGLALEPSAPFLIVLMFSFNYRGMCVHACTNGNMSKHVCRGQRPTSRVSSFLVDFGAPTQVVWLGDKHLFLLQYLTGSHTLSLRKLVASGV